MFFSIFIIEERFFADTLLQPLIRYRDSGCADFSIQHRHLQCVQGRSGVSICKSSDGLNLGRRNMYILAAETGRSY